jgi:uncharacterized membrane protein YccC
MANRRMAAVLDGLALLGGAPGYSLPRRRGFRLGIADWLPPLVNAVRAFLAIGAAALVWDITAWPSGADAIIFAAVVVCLFAPRGYGGAMVFTLGTAGAAVCAAIVNFAVLPGLVEFPSLCAAIGLVLVPVGFATAWSRNPAVSTVFTVWGILFLPLLGPTNQITYDPEQFYNFALAALAGCLLGALSFPLLPSLPPALRVRRLLALTLRDLRRLAMNSRAPTSEDWESRIYGRLAALPHQVEPLQLGQLLAALSAGTEIVQLRRVAPWLGVSTQLDPALGALALGNSGTAIARLGQLDHHLASAPDGAAETAIALRARSHPGALRGAHRISPLLRLRSVHMRFTEINLFGVYVAPISLMMVGAWLVTIALRRVANRFGLLEYVWHPALFGVALYVIVLSSWGLIIGR